MNFLYPAGVGIWHTTYTTDTVTWVLLKETADFNSGDTSIADLEPFELSVSGYTRLPVASRGKRPVGLEDQDVLFVGTDPTWAALPSGTSVGFLVMVDETTDTPLAMWQFPPAVTDGSELGFRFPSATNVDPSAPPGTKMFHRFRVMG